MRFSVIIPVHNKAAHLQAAVQSVLRQVHSDFELLVIDDASKDGGVEELKSSVSDPRIRYLRRDTPGPGGYAARNVGIHSATADWVAFLDADDEWEGSFLASVQEAIIAIPDAGFAATAHWSAGRSGDKSYDAYTAQHNHKDIKRIDTEEFLRSAARGLWPTHTSATACRRQLLLDLGGFPEGRCSRGGDRDTWLRLALTAPLARSPVVGATYFRDSDNMVTRNVPHPEEPCTVQTVRQAIAAGPRRPSRIKTLLKRLHNASHRSYLKRRILRAEISWTDLTRLYFFANPGYSLFIALAAFFPKTILRALLGVRRRQA